MIEAHLEATLAHWSVIRPVSFLDNMDDPTNGPLKRGKCAGIPEPGQAQAEALAASEAVRYGGALPFPSFTVAEYLSLAKTGGESFTSSTVTTSTAEPN